MKSAWTARSTRSAGLSAACWQPRSSVINGFYLPLANLEQALLVPDIEVKAAAGLRDVYLDLAGTLPLKTVKSGGGRLAGRPPKRPSS